MNLYKELVNSVIKEVVRQEPNPILRRSKEDKVKRSIDTTYSGERERGRKR